MNRILILVAALVAAPVFAQDSGVVDAGVAAAAPAPMLVPMAALSTDAGVDVKVDVAAEVNMVKTVFTAVKTGNWWLAAGAFLVLVVSLLRTAGKKFHEWLPDNNILDKPLIFLYDTKVGGWLLNWFTALAGGIGTAMAAGVAVDFTLWKSVVMVSTSASVIFELYKDIMEWVKARKAAAVEEASKKLAVVAPAIPPVEPPKP